MTTTDDRRARSAAPAGGAVTFRSKAAQRTIAIAVTTALLAAAVALAATAPDPPAAVGEEDDVAVAELAPEPDPVIPRFSHASGFYSDGFDLEISVDTPGVEIHYTLDGSYPDLDANPERTRVYDGPIAVTDRAGDRAELADIETTVGPRTAYFATRPTTPRLEDSSIELATVVRARAGSRATTTATFFVGDDLRRDDMTVLSLALDPGYLFDHDTGIYLPGSTFGEYLDSEDFDDELTWNVPTNYNQRGRLWERPPPEHPERTVVMEVCAPGGECVFQQQIGVRAHGGFSRSYPQKSLRLYARGVYGDARFDHPLFGDDGPIGHRRLILRNSGNDNQRLMFLDAYVQSLLGHLAADTQAYEPVAVFLNGEYWGIHNLRERYDRHYLEVVHGADLDAIEFLDNTSGPLEGEPAGAVDAWNDWLTELGLLHPFDERFAAHVEQFIDVDSFYDVVIAHVFAGNGDWGSNNMRWWRETDGPHHIGQGTRDGRWRWLISDFDHMGERSGRYNLDIDLFETTLAFTEDPTEHDGLPFLFSWMTTNDELRERFIARFSAHLNTTFAPGRTLDAVEQFRSRLAGEFERHGARWQTLGIDEWHDEVDRLAGFMSERPERQVEHLRARFGLGATVGLHIRTDGPGEVFMNGVDLPLPDPGGATAAQAGTFAGVPLALAAVADDGHRFAGWHDADGVVSHDTSLVMRPDGDVHLTAVFEPS